MSDSTPNPSEETAGGLRRLVPILVIIAAVAVLSGGVLLLQGSAPEPDGATSTSGDSPTSAIPATATAAGNGSPTTLANASPPDSTATVPESQTETQYDGSWRFVSGSLDGATFGNPPTWISLDIAGGQVHISGFACDMGRGPVEIHEDQIALGPINQEEPVCYSPPHSPLAMFDDSIHRVEHIALDGSDLVLSGTGVELRFTTPETPKLVGDLPLTHAGATISFDPPDGEAATQYVVTERLENFGLGTIYLLAAQPPESEVAAPWERWAWDVWTDEPTRPDAAATAPGPHTVVVPDTILDGDYYLCSPYWEPDPFCFTLLVRPPSGPWFVTAGLDGIVLHDANGTWEAVVEAPTAIAFYVDDQLVFQLLDSMDQIQLDGAGPMDLADGERLGDVALVDGQLLALVMGPDTTTVIDLDTHDRTPVGPHATEGRIADDLIVLRTAPDRISVYDTATGTLAWERVVGPETLATLDGTNILRLVSMSELVSDAGPEPYFTHLSAELVDMATGETIESSEWEVQAIPDDGDNIAEPCGRPDFDGELLLCPQPDGRIVMMDWEGGSRTFADGAMVATFVREAR